MPILPKPPACQGCPAYEKSRGWVPDFINDTAQIMVVAQNPGTDEEAGRRYLGLGPYGDTYEEAPHQPLLGKTGRMFNGTFLPLAGVTREDCSLGNALRCRWGNTNELPPLDRKEMQQAILHCHRAHWRRPERVTVFVAMGEYATAMLTGITRDFSGWRGYMLPLSLPGAEREPHTAVWSPKPYEPRVFVTHHLAYLFKEPTASLPAKRDWNKLATILAGKWPIPMSPIEADPPEPWPDYAAFDTEFAIEQHDHLIRWSLANRERRVWVVEADRNYQATFGSRPTVVMHNAPADLPHLKGLLPLDQVDIEDTMYAHACLYTGKVETDDQKGKTGGAMSHTLNFLGSLYGHINRWKHLARVSPRVYAGGDALGTMDVWETGLHGGLKGELERDPETRWVYENLQKPLIPIVLKHHQRGIATDPEQVKIALAAISERQQGYVLQAQAFAGWPLNLRSPKQLAYWLFDVEGIKVRRKLRAH